MKECLFCKIAARQIPSKTVYEDDRVLAFEDINPQAPVHLLVIPKRHVASVQECADDPGLVGHLLLAATKLAEKKGIATSGYRLITNTGPHAGQTVFHLHVHLLGGRPMAWPPG
ncbi:histidine triad nucleotide-binding protein [Candidatus Nitrospira bockiana]